MERAIRTRPAGQWPRHSARGTVTLPYDGRHRRRTRLKTDGGGWVMLDLREAAVMHDGDGLQLESGGWVLVRAADEVLAEITCDDPGRLTRIAWHLGNRHVPTQIENGRLRIRNDHVITALAVVLGGQVRIVEAPFDPEAGAYVSREHTNHARIHSE
ncbi:MAG: Urease accessory protein UreE [Deltaproteobacteria bacterium]|nr:Urease accessory protein UreE [Deltaproteobacteria bacterium]